MLTKLLLLYVLTFDSLFYTAGQSSTSFFLGEPTSEYLKSADAENPRPPVLLLPGLVSSRLVAWKRKVCRGPDINIQDVVWLNLQKLVETMTYDHHCWIDCMKLGKNGTDPPDCKIRADEGLSAIGELSPGNIYTPPATSIFTPLIKMLAHELGYDRNSIIGAPYDWRLAPIQLQQRDSYFKTLKQWLEVAVERHRRPAIVIAHSMGTNIFMYFCDWLRVHDKPSMGYERWMRKHVWAYIGMAAPLLGSPGALKSVMSGHQFGLTITEMQARELQLTFASTHFLNPRSSQNLANRMYKNLMKNTTGDYTDPLIIIKSASGSSQVNFGISDVENGEIFRWVGNMYKEPLMIEKYEALQELYLKDPLTPLSGSYKRPPVRHVLMVYGVDLPTEIAYTYRISDSNNPGPPILDEIFYEEPKMKVKEKEKERDRGGDEENSRDGEGDSDEERNGENIDSDSDTEFTLLHEEKLHSFGTPPIDTEDSLTSTSTSSGYVNSMGEWIDILEKSDVTGDSDLSTSSENIIPNFNNMILGKKNQNAVTIADNSKSGKELKKTLKGKKKKKGNNDVYAVKTKKPSFSQSQRRFVRSEEQVHSGDNTVPYVSLSHAHKWLEDDSTSSTKEKEGNKKWTELRPEVTHKNLFDSSWATLKMASAVTTVDPAVEMFHSTRSNGDTTVVMEFAGVDHLDIAKHPYVHFLLFENLLTKMSSELCLNETDTTCEKGFKTAAEKKPYFNFPISSTDVKLMSRKISDAASHVVETIKDRYQ